jgi:integrase
MSTNNSNYNGHIAFFYRGSWNHRTKRVDDNGIVKYSKIGGFKTPKEAEESYYKCKQEFEDNYAKLLYKQPECNENITLKNYLIYWYNNILSKRVQSTTAMTMSYCIYKLVIPCMPYDLKLSVVTTEYINDLLKQINKLGTSTANKTRETLNLAFKDALKNHFIQDNVIERTDCYRRNKPNITILTKDEIKKLLDQASNDNWYLEILLGLFCGLRKGEIFGLKFQDIDFEKKTLTITRQLSHLYKLEDGSFTIKEIKKIEKNPKTNNSIRTIKLPDIVMQEIEKRKEITNINKEKFGDKYVDNDYVCCQANGIPHGLSCLNSYLIKTCNKIGISRITVHGLRHMYATILIENNVSLQKISALLGHSSIHTTFDLYCDVMNEDEDIRAYLNNTYTLEEEYEQ